MLDKMRGVLAPSLETLGRVFAKTGLSPNVWTAIGLILSLAAAVSYTSSEWVQGIQAWHAITVGSILLLASGFFDIVDGQVARPYLVFLAVTFSLLVSYARSRAESSGVQLRGVGIGERPERLLVLALVGMAGFLEYALAGIKTYIIFTPRNSNYDQFSCGSSSE